MADSTNRPSRIEHVRWKDWVRGVEIEPSLYAANFLRLGEQIDALLAAGARIFHVDVGDGRFIPPVTIGPVVVQSIASVIHDAGGKLDCHLMVADPTEQIRLIAASGGDSITFHVEVVDDPAAIVALAREHDLGAGIAFNPDTDVEQAASAADGADLLLCMSVRPGYSGQTFIPESLERIRRLRELVQPGTLIQVDGGLTGGNIDAVHQAGADLIVAGSAIFYSDDVAAAYTGLVRALA
jgi:ribulose-phosphate 3-epimerase